MSVGAFGSVVRSRISSGPPPTPGSIAAKLFRKQLTIQSMTYVAGGPWTLPVVNIISSDAELAAHMNADASDLVLGTANGLTVYPHDTIWWANSPGNLMVASEQTVTSASNASVYAYYGELLAPQTSNPPAVWHAYRDVRFFNHATAVIDRSGNNGDLANVGAPTLAWDSTYGIHAALNGTNMAYTYAAGPIFDNLTAFMTLIGRASKATATNDARLVAQQLDGTENGARYMIGAMSALNRCRGRFQNIAPSITLTGGAISTSVLNYPGMKYDSTVAGGTTYLLGLSGGVVTNLNSTVTNVDNSGLHVDATHPTGFGYDGNGTNWWNGNNFFSLGAQLALDNQMLDTLFALAAAPGTVVGAEEANPHYTGP